MCGREVRGWAGGRGVVCECLVGRWVDSRPAAVGRWAVMWPASGAVGWWLVGWPAGGVRGER